jgi:thiol-disulfide isomerase/thioredoxin
MTSKFLTTTSRLLLAAIILLAIFTSGCSSKQPDRPAMPVNSSSPAGPLQLPPASHSELDWMLADGKPGTLADYLGKVVVLDYYATSSAACRESMPRLNALQEKYGAEGLQVVGLNVGGADDRSKVAEFATELKITYPLGFPGRHLTDLFLSRDQEIPQTFVFNRAGQLIARYAGYEDSTADDLEKLVVQLLSEQ